MNNLRHSHSTACGRQAPHTPHLEASPVGHLLLRLACPTLPLQLAAKPKFQLESDSSSTIVRPALPVLTTYGPVTLPTTPLNTSSLRIRSLSNRIFGSNIQFYSSSQPNANAPERTTFRCPHTLKPSPPRKSYCPRHCRHDVFNELPILR